MKSVEEAQAEVLANFRPLGVERLPLLAGLGRFLHADVLARVDSPPFDNSAMDGYAVRALETAGATRDAPQTLRVVGESRAGGPLPSALEPGSAMRIFTGAPVPDAADAVVLQEDTERSAGAVRIFEAVRSGANLRRQGSDLRRGERALAAHTRIGAGEVAALASQEIASVDVFRRPRVALLCTGDELRDIGEPARPGSIVNSNAYGLAAQILEAGGEPLVLPPVGDRLEQVRTALQAGFDADLLLVTGGVSVGEYDVVRDALAAEGIALDFWKVRMKPGKPLAFARRGALPIFGLPGNPVSCFVTFELFVRPAIRVLLGARPSQRPRVKVELAEAVVRKPGRTEFARAELRYRGERAVARFAKRQGSGAVSALANVDALVVLPAESETLPAGSELDALLLTEWKRGSDAEEETSGRGA